MSAVFFCQAYQVFCRRLKQSSTHRSRRRIRLDGNWRSKAPIQSDTVVGQTDFDVTIGQCVASDRNLACAVQIIRHKTLSDGKVKVCLIP